ncbi:MAG: 2-hydroxyacyl-CoA dehydratase family protein [Desulfomonile sp.]|nr:2-hydroxyacyl-CoA dehydratase family protein [Desulfomonile sp.]
MKADDPWKPFRDIAAAPLEFARSWKVEHGGKVVGHLIPDVPEEILHAAGALPFAIEGAGVSASHAQAYLPAYTCNHAMGALEMALRGDLDMLDGMVIPYVCDTTRNLVHLWQRLFPNMPSELLRLPKRIEFGSVRDYACAEFARLAELVGAITGRTPSTNDLAASITLYNSSRASLRRAYKKHRENPSIWTAENLRVLLTSASRAPREEHLAWMEGLPWDDGAPSTSEAVPVYVRGKVWDPPDVLAMFDRLGLVVVSDEVATGFRWIQQDAPADREPIDALVDRYLATIPYAGYHAEPRALVAGFVERVKASGARGVIFLNPKFCEAAGFDMPDFSKALENAQIPTLILETSTRGVSSGQIQVRLEAFREMISGELP